jgi:uncharacterized NAD-dependent epimerase/dehydratase family protein
MTHTPVVQRQKDGNAIVYCPGAFGTTNGKTAHGLIRRTERYRTLSVVDSNHAGQDAGAVLDNRPNGITIYATINEAYLAAFASPNPATHLVMGLAPDGGRLSEEARGDIRAAIGLGLNIDSGLHDFISDDPTMASLARKHGVIIRDIRKTPPRSDLHFFTGKIAQVKSLKVALLGTDSAVGKRTTAWLFVEALRDAGLKAEMVGTGQTAWMQGARYSIILDSLINDFISGEIEHAIWSAWHEERPDVIVIEGQGSLLNPAYPGGFEILAAGRPDIVILQHAPARSEYDGFPGYAIHPLATQIEAIELVSSKPVVAIAVNPENMTAAVTRDVCREITESTGLPAMDPLAEGAGTLVAAISPYLKPQKRRRKVASAAKA